MAAYPTTAPVVPKVEQGQLDDLKTDQAETKKVELTQQGPSTAATSADKMKTGTATTGTLAEGADASFQANKIMAEDSPLMRQARNQGMLSAASRGLGNSSIAAGAAQAEATKAAVPLAQQNAQQTQNQQLANQKALNEMEGLNVTEANKGVLTDAEAENRMQQQYDDTVGRADMQNADAENKAAQQKFSADAELNRTWLSGEISQTLAQIQGQYQEIIAVNQSAASMYSNTMDGLAEMWASNASMKEKTSFTTSTINFLQNSLGVTASIASMDFRTSGLGAGVETTVDQVKDGTTGTNILPGTRTTDDGGMSSSDAITSQTGDGSDVLARFGVG